MHFSVRAAFAVSHEFWYNIVSILVCLKKLFNFLFKVFFNPLFVQIVSLLKTQCSYNNWFSPSRLQLFFQNPPSTFVFSP